jgi:hypothetical protein
MQTLFWASYFLLWGLVVVEAVVVREVVRHAVWLKRLYVPPVRLKDVAGLPSGTPAPDFSGRLLGKDRTLTMWDLKGDPSILLFVAPKDSHLPGYRQLSIALHALRHRVEGHLYLVCGGTEGECRRFALGIETLVEGEIPIIVDREASIAQGFRVESTPVAVELDEDLLVSRYGSPSVQSLS